MIALIWEVWNDAAGDTDKKRDVYLRAILLVLEGVTLFAIFGWPIPLAWILSTSIHFLLFDYIIAYVLIKNGTLEPPRGVTYHWFTYTAKSGVVDNLKFWKNLNPWLKLLIRVGYFGLALTLIIL